MKLNQRDPTLNLLLTVIVVGHEQECPGQSGSCGVHGSKEEVGDVGCQVDSAVLPVEAGAGVGL